LGDSGLQGLESTTELSQFKLAAISFGSGLALMMIMNEWSNKVDTPHQFFKKMLEAILA
jgi:hypothetical protein